MRGFWRFLLVLAAFAVLPQQAAAVEPAPLELYGNLPRIEDAAISHSGAFVAAVMTVDGHRRIVILNSENKPVNQLKIDGVKVRSIRFVGDEALLVIRSATVDVSGFAADKYEMSQAIVVPVDPKKDVAAVFAKNHQLADAIFGLYGIRKSGAAWNGYFGAIEYVQRLDGYHFDNGNPALYSVDLETMKVKRIAGQADHEAWRDWIVGGDGSVAATFDMSRATGKWSISNSSGTQIVTGKNWRGNAGLVGLGKSGDTLIYSAEDETTGENHWYEIPLAGGEPKLFLDDIDVERTYWNRDTGEMLGYLKNGTVEEPVFYNEKFQKIAGAVKRAFPQSEARLIEWTPDFMHLIVRTDGGLDSGTWFLVDLAGKSAIPLGYERPEITPERVGPISRFEYKAQDGLDLDGILTLPPGRDPNNLPVVLLPHGGPHAYDSERFDWWAQAFASRGYAVFQPNYRGSTNRDQTFRRAGYGEWGRKMQTDISDGLAALAEKGIVDPKRACIVGASYGGYAALAGVTLQKDLYRCAVSVGGVSDIGLMYRTDSRESGDSNVIRRSLKEDLGSRDNWDDISPREHAAEANAPILLIHGKDDTVVSFQQSTKMADALKDAGKPYRLVPLEGEDHWLSNAETRKRMLLEAVAFVEKYDPAYTASEKAAAK